VAVLLGRKERLEQALARRFVHATPLLRFRSHPAAGPTRAERLVPARIELGHVPRAALDLACLPSRASEAFVSMVHHD